MASQTIATGTAANLSATTFTYTGYTFAGWNTQANGGGISYAQGASFTMGKANVTLYAQWASTVKALVLDSINGSSLTGAVVTVVDGSGNAVETETTGSDGSASLTRLAYGTSYTVTAKDTSRAASAMQDYVAEAGDAIGLYCYALGITGTAQVPPHIESLQYSTNGGSTWQDLANGATLPNGGFEIQAVSAGVVAVQDTSWSGFGIGIDLDRMPTWLNSLATPKYSVTASPVTGPANDYGYSGDIGKFQTIATFEITATNPLPLLAGAHVLEIVSYDVANNRVEKHVAITIN
jgi:uncharacterized repeat protein (TIGR02543 family)